MTNIFFPELKFVHRNRDVMLSHSQEAAYSDNDRIDLAAAIQDQLINIPKPFIRFVVNFEAYELGGASITLLHHWCIGIRACCRSRAICGGWSGLGKSRAVQC